MKYVVISLFLISCVGFIIPQVFSAGENFFYGTATFERPPTAIIPNIPTEFEIKFHYTSGSYALENLSPIIEVNPEDAKSKVNFDVESVNVYQNDIVRIPVTITVDPSIEYEKIFLSISYAGIGLHNVPFKSSWSDSIIFDIDHDVVKKNNPSSNDEEKTIPSPLKQFKSGIPIDEIQCKEGLELILKSSDDSPVCVKPETKQKLIEREWAKPTTIENASNSKYAEMDVVQKLLTQNQIEYITDKLIVTSGPVTGGDPRCGAVIDVNYTTHWFTIDSISKPQKMTLYTENPHQCQVNTASCFCNAQMALTALTLDELSYFSPEEEEMVANTLIDYLVKENINRTPKFMIGKFNINYTDPSAIGYCGELWGYNTIDYFDGAIVNNQIKDYGLAKELSPLCAIAEDAKWWEKK